MSSMIEDKNYYGSADESLRRFKQEQELERMRRVFENMTVDEIEEMLKDTHKYGTTATKKKYF